MTADHLRDVVLLDDDQLVFVMAKAASIPVADRDDYLRRVAGALGEAPDDDDVRLACDLARHPAFAKTGRAP
jgi:hypothetical protein